MVTIYIASLMLVKDSQNGLMKQLS